MSDTAAKRREIYRIHDWVLKSGLTAITQLNVVAEGAETVEQSDFLKALGYH